MNNPPELEIDFLLHVQLETLEHPWHATLEPVGDHQARLLEFYSPLELARHVANLQKPDLKSKGEGLK
jgi:hypothetical protein